MIAYQGEATGPEVPRRVGLRLLLPLLTLASDWTPTRWRGSALTFLGAALLLIAAAWIGYKLSVSYKSAGGTAYEVPVYDAAIYPPILAAAGSYFLLRGLAITWPIWTLIIIWIGTTVLVALGIKACEEFGDRPLR